ncbi:netrin receptor UNC5C-like [Diadema setosum]|uniref:netrin receptor UNC5C-like n=1 Tax=Diadema setosum TaxID=31175 RepID=UPI003B3BDF73
MALGELKVITSIRNQYNIVEILLRHKADVSVKDRFTGQTPLLDAAEKGYDRIVRLLIEAQAEVEEKSGDGSTALHLACRNRHWACVYELLKAGARVDEKANKGLTPLHIAVQRNDFEITEILLRYEADVNTEDSFGRTPLDYADDKGKLDVMHLLRDAHAAVDSKTKDQANPQVTGTFNEAGGELVLEEYGVRMLIPAGAIDTERRLISLELLCTAPRIDLSPDEMVVCWAFRCEPSHLDFKKSITIKMPHCGEMVVPDNVHTVLYSWPEYKNGQPYAVTRIEGRQEEGDNDVPTCIVRKGYLELRINHFSWYLVSLIWNSIPSWRRIRKRVLITPYMPRTMPQSRVLHLRIHVYDDVEGHDKKILSEERDSGYNIVHPSTDLKLDPGIDVTVRCEDRTSQNVHDKRHINYTTELPSQGWVPL